MHCKKNRHNNVVVSIDDVNKKFKLYSSNKDRFKEIIHPLGAKYHQEYWALKNISLEITKGNTIAILGRNGSGKSTLLQIIASIMQPTMGSVYVKGRVSALLELGAGFNPFFSGKDNAILNGVIQGINEEEMNRRLPEIESFADIGRFFYQPVGTYSSGMFIRLAFAVATSLDPDIIIIDEALSIGDAKFQHKCFNKFQEYVEQEKTIIVVSHDLETASRICRSGIVLDEGQIIYDGDISQAVNIYQETLYGGSKKTISTKKADDLDFDEKIFDKCNENPGYNINEKRMGDGRAAIIDYDVITNKDINPEKIKYGEDFKIKVKIIFYQQVKNVHFGYAIVTKENVTIHGTNTQMQNNMPVDIYSNELLELEFDVKSCFVGGDYFLNLGVFCLDDGNVQYLDTRRSIGHIVFSETDWCRGFVAFPPEYNLCKRTKVKDTIK